MAAKKEKQKNLFIIIGIILEYNNNTFVTVIVWALTAVNFINIKIKHGNMTNVNFKIKKRKLIV